MHFSTLGFVLLLQIKWNIYIYIYIEEEEEEEGLALV
jgi:hypothetical protein